METTAVKSRTDRWLTPFLHFSAELIGDKAMIMASKLLSAASHFNFASTLIEVRRE